jgi:hypothetical protein
VDVADDATAYPLRVPDAGRGISLTGEFQIKQNAKLKLAIDFDAGHDVVKIERNGNTEYILKPRLTHFDLDNAGAIIGSIDATAAGNNHSAQFVFKAEQIAPNGQVHVVRRVTALVDQTGKFILFPLLPGNYDIVMRGINYETVIVKDVPVVKGTTPQSQPTVVPEITMTPATTQDYMLDATIASPTGAWLNFMQTLPGLAKSRTISGSGISIRSPDRSSDSRFHRTRSGSGPITLLSSPCPRSPLLKAPAATRRLQERLSIISTSALRWLPPQQALFRSAR